MPDRILTAYQDWVRRLEDMPYPNPSSVSMLAHARKELADYLEFKAGRIPLADLSLDLRQQISGWVMPQWGTYGT